MPESTQQQRRPREEEWDCVGREMDFPDSIVLTEAVKNMCLLLYSMVYCRTLTYYSCYREYRGKWTIRLT